jgi:hypothetical protein
MARHQGTGVAGSGYDPIQSSADRLAEGGVSEGPWTYEEVTGLLNQTF